jgi:hypothetical protein
MVSNILALLLVMASGKADPMDTARKAYNNCVVKVVIDSLDKKSSQSAYNESVAAGCQTERTIYRDMLVKSEIGYGSKRSEAEQYADEEIQTILDVHSGSYGDHQQNNTRPVPEK